MEAGIWAGIVVSAAFDLAVLAAFLITKKRRQRK
jgi:hypothetical protein